MPDGRSGPHLLGQSPLISPFQDPADELPFAGRSLRAFRREEVRASGIDSARVHFARHAIATAPVLAELARRAPRGRPSRLALPAASPARSLAPLSSIERSKEQLLYDVFLDLPEGTDLEAARRIAEPTRVELPFETRRRELARIGPPPHHLDLPSDGSIAAHVEHWVHVLWLAPLLVPRAIAMREGRLRKEHHLPPSRIARSARVHPTAHLEGSYVGENVRIGAFASLRHTYVGRDSFVSDFTKLSGSVLGDGTHTLADASLVSVVSLGQSTLASLGLKDTLLGRSVFLTSGVIFWSESLDGTITAEKDGLEVDTETKVLGGCAGHLCVLGARTIIGPGRALPNRTTVVMRKEEGVFKIPKLPLGTPTCWHDGALVPYGELRAGEIPEELEA
ncbi:MAG: hypothetical protein HYV07_01095 [Deltaproteobacteria bacterium]|nr:hypothetical protein [Deltaproteobacteria bacterium]